MKKFVLALFALMLLAGTASAQTNIIGVFADDAGTDCDVVVAPYAAFNVYFLAILDMVTVESITAAEFRIDGVLPNTGYPVASFNITWNTTLVILADGGAGNGVSLAFGTPLVGPVALLGSVANAVVFDAGLIPAENTMMTIMPHVESGKLAVVDDAFETFTCMGWGLVMNCTLPDCGCEIVPAENTSISSLKALY